MDSNGYCEICRRHWSEHNNVNYRWVIKQVYVANINERMKELYGEATEGIKQEQYYLQRLENDKQEKKNKESKKMVKKLLKSLTNFTRLL